MLRSFPPLAVIAGGPRHPPRARQRDPRGLPRRSDWKSLGVLRPPRGDRRGQDPILRRRVQVHLLALQAQGHVQDRRRRVQEGEVIRTV